MVGSARSQDEARINFVLILQAEFLGIQWQVLSRLKINGALESTTLTINSFLTIERPQKKELELKKKYLSLKDCAALLEC